MRMQSTYTMDLTRVEEKITARTKAIVVVHLYGRAVDVAPIRDLVKQHDIKIIEDAAQAHGAAVRGVKVGKIGMQLRSAFTREKTWVRLETQEQL